MKFGKVSNPEAVDFTIPEDHPGTKEVFHKYGQTDGQLKVYVGCAKWNRQDLKNFYPRGTKDELAYYGTQFNAIEMNATFYRIFPEEQFEKWREKVPKGFRFFPKLPQEISHFKQLNQVGEVTDRFLAAAIHLEEHLGCFFLQMNERFTPKQFERLRHFVESWPQDVRLAVELRHEDWYSDSEFSKELYELLEHHGIGNVLVDTAGRRDLMHMRMTNARPFIRWVGANHSSDYTRLDDWVNRIGLWIEQGMTELDFFVHQNLEEESPLLAAYLIEKLNEKYGFDLKVPVSLSDLGNQGSLF
ncbi:MAG: DUF72 domain-containing protein [Bacteroidetes bacterium]|nr:MAG: DUF72 domain-containing protein [Bacteroidota bacterium]